MWRLKFNQSGHATKYPKGMLVASAWQHCQMSRDDKNTHFSHVAFYPITRNKFPNIIAGRRGGWKESFHQINKSPKPAFWPIQTWGYSAVTMTLRAEFLLLTVFPTLALALDRIPAAPSNWVGSAFFFATTKPTITPLGLHYAETLVGCLFPLKIRVLGVWSKNVSQADNISS